MGEFWNTGLMAFDDVAGMADAALELRRFVVSPFSTNCYAVVSCGKAMVVDPGAEGARIAEALSDVDVELVVATHGHAACGGDDLVEGIENQEPTAEI